jgi:hypothetical protein
MANSDTKIQPWHSDRIVLVQFRGLSANRKLCERPPTELAISFLPIVRNLLKLREQPYV